MLTWLLLGMALYYVQIFIPAIFKLAILGVWGYLGPRDNEPTLGGVPARLERATENMKENFPVFVGLAVSILALGLGDEPQAILGGQLFFVGRLFYIPLYAAGVRMARSLAIFSSWFGMILLVMLLLTLV